MRRRMLALVCSGMGALSLAGSALATAAPASASPKATPLTVVLPYVPDVESFAEYWALDHGLYAKEGLNVTLIPGGGTIDQVQEVVAGKAAVGIAPPESIVAAIGAGAKLEVYGAEFQQSPIALTCRADSGVKTIKELKGKIVGVKPTAGPIFDLFLRRNGLSPSAVHEVAIGASDVSEIIAGQIQCEFTTFKFNEPKEIEDAGVPVRVFPIAAYGLPDQGDAFFSTRAFFQAPGSKAVLEKFMAATAQAWTVLLKTPAAAAKWFVGKNIGPGLSLSQQEYQAAQQVTSIEGPATKTHGLLWVVPSIWKMTARELVAEKVTKHLVNVVPDITDSIVEAAHTPKL